MIISGSMLVKIINISDKCVEKIKTHIFMSYNLFSENCAVYEIMWKYMVQLDRPQVTIQYGACAALHAG
jgi:hypothetical protein